MKQLPYLFDQINDAVFLYQCQKDNLRKLIDVNQKACELLGYKREELFALKTEELFTYKLSGQFSDSKKERAESKLIAKDKIVPVEISIKLFTEQGKKFALLVARDITARLEKEESLKDEKDELKAYNEVLENVTQELDRSYYTVNQVNQSLEEMIELTTSLSKVSVQNQNKFLSNLLTTALEIVPEADYGKIYLFKEGYLEFKGAVGHDLSQLKELMITQEAFCDNTNQILIFDGLFREEFFSQLDKQRLKRASKAVKQTMAVNFFVEDEKIGGLSLEIAESNEASFSQISKRLIKVFSYIANSLFRLQKYNQMQNEFQEELIISITQMLEIHDRYTKGHSQSVAQIAQQVARKMGLPDQKITDAYWAGIVHDIGKTVVPREILNKKGRLTDEEYEIIKKHPKWGYLTLKNSKHLKRIAEYVLAHHERWDGEGYPRGLKKDEIPLIAQIITVADAWDAMCSNRSYRDKMFRETALQEIKKNKGTQFAPKVVDAFLELLAEQNKLTG
ncbi:HD domain-containing protein [Natroniella sulfidigena]|uniref:HD domain-containing phosphohydrolase n=1 Tax=Natroniella sulfidigena TaxID=723921 RepID=UPI00200A574D|nr:HD domain-containing phosphohydrolase [Natroniella sulfidigena]MCK8817435.1 HD domain-containing protein [Natroniella sulfidigena]